MNETVTEGFRYTLFALETLREERTIGGVGELDSPFIVDNSTSFDFEWFDQFKNDTNGTSQEHDDVGTSESHSPLSVDNSTNFDFGRFDRLRNTTNENLKEETHREEKVTTENFSSTIVEDN